MTPGSADPGMGVTLGLFTKPPIPGEVKTRLTPPLTAEQAALLYGAMHADTAAAVHAAGHPWGVFSTDVARQRDLWPAAAPEPGFWASQEGDDLGDRMLRAARAILHPDPGGPMPGASPTAPDPAPPLRGAVLVGSDHPTVPASRYREAARTLGDADLVLGPSADGGYYLVGVKALHPTLFHGIPWSTGAVLSLTLARARELGLSVRLLAHGFDVDTAEDLARLRSELAGERGIATGATPAGARATRAALASIRQSPR